MELSALLCRMLQHPMDYIPPMEAAIKEVLPLEILYVSSFAHIQMV